MTTEGPPGESATDLIAEMQGRTRKGTGRRGMIFSFGPAEEERGVTTLQAAELWDRPPATPAAARPAFPLSRLEANAAGALEKHEGINRLGFEVNPDLMGYQVIYQRKPRGIPEWLLKRLARTDDLVGAIVRTRANQIKAFGVPRADRHGTGFVLEEKEGVLDDAAMTDEKAEALHQRIERASKLLLTCGCEEGVPPKERLNFSDFLDMLVQNALIVGRIAIEKIADMNGQPHSFRPLDAGTIFPATPQQASGPTIRKQAARLLARLQNKTSEEFAKDINLKDWINDRYTYAMVIEGTPRQVFTDEQIVCKNFYPVPDIEMGGFPFTPLDNVATAVTTHINVTTYSRVYFQSGRAAKGALIFQSDDVDQEVLKDLQIHMQSNINSANNAWRMPVIAVGPNDKVTWQPIDQQGARDAEFQYLSDQVARAIMTAFQISPDEMTGWAYLSKGTSAQTLGESSNEYRLEAHRDLGLRPLLRQLEEIVNTELLPIVDPGLNEVVRFRMYGLDAEDPDKETTHLAEAAPLHMTLNQILEKVEKEPLPAHLGGEVVLNPQFHGLVLDKYVTVGWIREKLLGIPGASKDPRFDYVNNALFFQQAQLIQAAQQAQQQAQQAQEQAAAQQAQAPNTSVRQGPGAERSASPGTDGQDTRADDLQRSLDDTAKSLGKTEDGLIDLAKAERSLTPAMKRVLKQHRIMVQQTMKDFRADATRTTSEILATVDDLMRGWRRDA